MKRQGSMEKGQPYRWRAALLTSCHATVSTQRQVVMRTALAGWEGSLFDHAAAPV